MIKKYRGGYRPEWVINAYSGIIMDATSLFPEKMMTVMYPKPCPKPNFDSLSALPFSSLYI